MDWGGIASQLQKFCDGLPDSSEATNVLQAAIGLLEAQEKQRADEARAASESAAASGAAGAGEGDPSMQNMFKFIERARTLAKLQAARRADRAGAKRKGDGKAGSGAAEAAAAAAATPGAEPGLGETIEAGGLLAMDVGDEAGEHERFEHAKKRYREVEVDYELTKPPMFKAKTMPAAGQCP